MRFTITPPSDRAKATQGAAALTGRFPCRRAQPPHRRHIDRELSHQRSRRIQRSDDETTRTAPIDARQTQSAALVHERKRRPAPPLSREARAERKIRSLLLPTRRRSRPPCCLAAGSRSDGTGDPRDRSRRRAITPAPADQTTPPATKRSSPRRRPGARSGRGASVVADRLLSIALRENHQSAASSCPGPHALRANRGATGLRARTGGCLRALRS